MKLAIIIRPFTLSLQAVSTSEHALLHKVKDIEQGAFRATKKEFTETPQERIMNECKIAARRHNHDLLG